MNGKEGYKPTVEEIADLFYAFLVREGVYFRFIEQKRSAMSFVEEIRDTKYKLITRHNDQEWYTTLVVNGIVCWTMTKEGMWFWNAINDKWWNYITKHVKGKSACAMKKK